MSTAILPPPTGASYPYWDVSVLDTGNFTFPLKFALDPVPANHNPRVPSLSFLLRHSHSSSRTPTIFDLSISPLCRGPFTDDGPASPACLELVKNFAPDFDATTTVPDAVANGGIQPAEIENVILSHLHWDHIGDPRWFEHANFIVGAGSKSLLDQGYPNDPSSHFQSALLAKNRTTFLSDPETWPSLGPFPHANDYFNDGSLYIIDSPGHLAGHINVLVRIAPTPQSPNNWVYLAGDSLHHHHLLTGEAKVAVVKMGDREFCMHTDKKAAEAHIERIKQLEKMDGIDGVGVTIISAHDGEWYEKNKGGAMFWPGKL